MEEVSYVIAFTTGLLTFFAPCTFVALPTFLAYITSQATDPKNGSERRKFDVLKSALAYVLGFLLVFTLVGFTFTALGNSLLSNKTLLSRVGGIFMVGGGLFMLFGEKIPILSFLYRERKIDLKQRNRIINGSLFPFFIGATTAFAWTPCVGPVLGSILLLAGSSSDTPIQGASLLFVHGLGIAVPFLILALLFEKATPWIQSFSKYTVWIYRISALVLIIVGVSLFIGAYDLYSQQVYTIFLKLGLVN